MPYLPDKAEHNKHRCHGHQTSRQRRQAWGSVDHDGDTFSAQARRNEYGNTPAMVATQADCKEALSAVVVGGESARLKLAEDIEAAAAEAEAARLDDYMQKEER